MSWSFRIGRAFGTDVRLHFTFLLFLAWIGFGDYRAGGLAAAGAGVLFALLIFGCVLLHEFGHALAARRYGIPTPDIILLPIGGVARLARMPEEPGQEFVIAIAGPAVNVAIALVIYLIIGGSGAEMLQLGDSGYGVLSRVLTINVWLVLFNLIPAFPMDGGRMLRALLAMRLQYVRATQIAAWIGKALAIVFALFGLFGSPMLVFIAIFVFQGASMEVAAARMRETQRMPISSAMVTDYRVLRADANLAEALDSLLHATSQVFPVIGADNGVQGVVTQADLVLALQRLGPGAPVRQIMHTGIPVVPHSATLDQLMDVIGQRPVPAVFVTADDGRISGLITPESLAKFRSFNG